VPSTLSSRTCAAALVALLCCAANGQTLARKGWAGSGITVETWWQGAVLYQIDPMSFGSGNLKGIAQRLDYLQGLGVDAVVLSPFQLQPEFGRTNKGLPFDTKYGNEEDLDQLVREATSRKIRLFVDLPLGLSQTTQEMINSARFWLSRGIAGLRLTMDAGDAHEHLQAGPVVNEPWLSAAQLTDRMHQLSALCATYAGQRVLLWDLPDAPPRAVETTTYRNHRAVHSSPDSPQMVVDRRLLSIVHLSSDELRGALSSPITRVTTAQPTPVPESDASGHPGSFERLGDGAHNLQLAKLLAAALLAGRGAPLLYSGQESGNTNGDLATEDADSSSLLNWYRRLSALRHANAALRGGSLDMLGATNPDVVAWLRRPQASGSSTPPVLVVCNLTNHPEVMSFGPELRRLGMTTGTGMMHTLASSTQAASSDASLGSASVTHIELPAYGVYIGELTPQPGLENTPSPLRRRSAHSSP
jgi:glycosidase